MSEMLGKDCYHNYGEKCTLEPIRKIRGDTYDYINNIVYIDYNVYDFCFYCQKEFNHRIERFIMTGAKDE